MTRWQAAGQAVRRARRYAVPVVLIAFPLLLIEIEFQRFRPDPMRGMHIAFGAIEAVAFCFAILAIWLGSAAMVGWCRRA